MDRCTETTTRGLLAVHDGGMIELEELTKRFGPNTAVDGLSMTVQPGTVTGFLGPNGAGKSTTIRLILGLDRPTRGRATVNGRPLSAFRAPLTEVGVLLEARGVHPQRSARDHLRALAATTGIGDRRVDDVIELVGLDQVADQLAGGFSLGMGQRLGIASALLGDPHTVILDEPVNGLDPEGIRWIRGLLQGLAAEGRTVFVSSHLMSEMAMVGGRFVFIGRGKLIADLSGEELLERTAERAVLVRTPEMARLRQVLAADGVNVHGDGRDLATVTGLSAADIGSRAAASGLVLHELTPQRASLEDVFMELTQDAVEYQGASNQEVA